FLIPLLTQIAQDKIFIKSGQKNIQVSQPFLGLLHSLPILTYIAFLIGTAAFQTFFLKAFYILPDIGIDRTDALQHQFPQYIFPDIVGRTGASTTFVAGAYIMVLLAVKAFAGSKVQLIPAIRTEQKPREQSLPFRFC